MGLFDFLRGPAPQPLPAEAILVDVRSRAEFDSGHVSGAIHVPLDRFDAEIGRHAPDKAAPLIVYCRSGARSGMALSSLQRMGYQKAVNGGSVGSVAIALGRQVVGG